MRSRCQSTSFERALFGRRTVLSAEPLWQTMSVLNDISKVTRTMPKSTTSLQLDSKRTDTEDGHQAAPNPFHETHDQLGAAAGRASSLKRPGERSAVEELLAWLTRSLAVLAILS